jgi:hypothetical protein
MDQSFQKENSEAPKTEEQGGIETLELRVLSFVGGGDYGSGLIHIPK